MAHLEIHSDKINEESAKILVDLCPFSAIRYEHGVLDIDAACKMCRLCVKKGPEGVVTLEEDAQPILALNKEDWRGIAVFAEQQDGRVHGVTLELLGKARELAQVTGHPVYAVVIGSALDEAACMLLRYGADTVYTYDSPCFAQFMMEPYVNAFADFIERIKPSSVLVGATNLGRSLTPRVAARFRTGLTADCTRLEMKENTDLVQIRPAFGGNIMAQIVNPAHRPQFCTVRYKVFSAVAPTEHACGKIVPMELSKEKLKTAVQLLRVEHKKTELDLSEAERIVAVGRGVKTQEELSLARQLADALDAQLACTRPLVECGKFDVKQQIGLSGRTVKAKLIVTLGISGAVQFAAGMRNSECIVAVNQDPAAPIFDIAHYGLVGELKKVVYTLLEELRKGVPV